MGVFWVFGSDLFVDMSWCNIRDLLTTHEMTLHFTALLLVCNEAKCRSVLWLKKFNRFVICLRNSSIQETHHHPLAIEGQHLLVRNGKYTESNTNDNRHRASAYHPWKGTEQNNQTIPGELYKRLVHPHTWHSHVLSYTVNLGDNGSQGESKKYPL